MKEASVDFSDNINNKKAFFNKNTLTWLVILATIIYIWLLIWALWLKFNDNHTITLNYSWLSQMTLCERFLYDIIPFNIRFDHARQIMQLFYNTIVFIPFGVLLNLIFKKINLWRDIIICFCFSLFIELLQLFTLIGGFATHDLIMNTLGYFIGFLIYTIIFKKASIKFNIIFFIIVNIIITGVTVFSIINTIQNIEPIILILTRKI